MRVLDRVQEVVSSVIDARNDVAVTLGVGSPENNDAVETVVRLEFANVGTDVIKVGLLVRAGNKIIRALLLIGRNEVGIIDRGKRLAKESHVRNNLALKVVVQDLGAFHGLVEADAGDIPTTENEIVGVNHRKDVRDRDMDFLAVGISTNADGGRAEEGADVVGLLEAFLSVPSDVVAVGEDGGAQGSAIVTTNTNHHKTMYSRHVSL